MTIIVALLIIFAYWLGYQDGKLTGKENEEFNKLDRIIRGIDGGVEVPLRKERPPYDPSISMMKPQKTEQTNTEKHDELMSLIAKYQETVREVIKGIKK